MEGKIFTIKEYAKVIEEIKNQPGLTIEEIEPNENFERQFKIIKLTTNNIMIYNQEINEIKNWFENVYSYKEQKFRRLRTLGYKCDDYSDPYDALIELYNEAEIKRKRIQELETFIQIEENKQKGGNIDA